MFVVGSVVGKVKVQIYSPAYFASSMPSFGFCARERYDNDNLVKILEVIRRRKDRCESDLRCVWGVLLLKSEGADF